MARLLGLALFLVAGGLAVAQRGRSSALAPTAPVWPGLALVLDVWALAMQAGAPGVTALAEAAMVAVGPCRACIEGIVARLEGGASAAQAWSRPMAGPLPGSLAAAGRAALRTESDGTALEPVLRRLADRERAALASRGLVAARRASVWVVLPLGLCYLPAYLLLGVVPAVVGLIH